LIDSSNPSEFQYGGPPTQHHGPGFYDFFPGQGPPPHHNGEGPAGLVPPFMTGNPGNHPPASAPGLHDSIHQSGIYKKKSRALSFANL
jgi:hypothetical protein